MCFELVDGHFEPVLRAGGNRHRHTPGKFDPGGVGDPVRSREEDLVTRVEQGGEGLEDGLLRSVGDQHLVVVDVDTRVGRCVFSDRLSKFSKPGVGRVVVVRGVGRRSGGGGNGCGRPSRAGRAIQFPRRKRAG